MNLRRGLELILVSACLHGPGAASVRAQAEVTNSHAPALRVEVEPRVELLSLIFRLAGNSEYHRARVASYAQDAEAQFDRFRDAPVVQLAQELHRRTGVSFDAVMGMAVHLSGPEDWRLRTALEPWPESLDQRWDVESASNFVAAARQFVQESRFAEFVRQHQPLYTTTVERLQKLLQEKSHLEWFNAYFGARPGATFTVVPALLNGGNCYGPHFKTPNGQEELYCILGVWQTDADGLPEFKDEVLDTVVHEFCHSYANPLVERHLPQLHRAGDALFRAVAARMQSQNYGSGDTLLRESLVRACTCRYVLQFQGTEAAQRAVQREKARGFLWMPELYEVLGDYEANRSTYATLDAFAPQLVSFFRDYAQGFAQGQTLPRGTPPKVVSLTPANGATAADPNLTEIRVQFDRAMAAGSWSMCGGGPHFPEIVGKPHYDNGATNWTVSVKLKPEWDYEFWLNSESFQGFRSAENVPLESVAVKFRTAGASTNSPSSE